MCWKLEEMFWTIVRADGTIASYINALASKKQSDGAESLKGGTILLLLKFNLQ